MSFESVIQTNGLVVDIDDTLADTAVYCSQQIAREFPETLRGESAESLMATYRQPGLVPVWQLPEIHNRMAFYLNDTTFLEAVPLIAEANETLMMIHAKAKPVGLYLTSRLTKHESVTRAWLERHGFPRAPVMLRDEHERRADWKLHLLAERFPDTWGLIEDNGTEILASNAHYTGRLFILDRYNQCLMVDDKLQVYVAHDWREMGRVVGG